MARSTRNRPCGSRASLMGGADRARASAILKILVVTSKVTSHVAHTTVNDHTGPESSLPIDSLREFMAHLESRGRLARVREPVSPVLEITEIHTRLLAERGPAVLFENVEGHRM